MHSNNSVTIKYFTEMNTSHVAPEKKEHDSAKPHDTKAASVDPEKAPAHQATEKKDHETVATHPDAHAKTVADAKKAADEKANHHPAAHPDHAKHTTATHK